FRFVNTLFQGVFEPFRSGSAFAEAVASGEANYMPTDPIWEAFCEKFFTKLPKTGAMPQSRQQKSFEGLGTVTSIQRVRRVRSPRLPPCGNLGAL
ncbi:hypothetical protein, partial [Xanthomonas euvesicatoria]